MAERASNGVVRRLHSLLALGSAAEHDDVDLLRRFTTQADAAAFAVLVRRHGPMVLGVCRRLLRDSADADDAFQATFAVLIRKAVSLSHPEQLAGWLFRVAYRTASRARSGRLRRHARELPLEDVPVEGPIAEIVWRELQPIFDEEVNRLPDNLRLPVVLCLMEGRTKRAAARMLDWPEGTFSSRLQRARELLRGRLARRGVTIPSSALSLALVQGTTSAAVPSPLLAATIQSASLIAAGSALPAPVAMLAQGVIHSMFIAKLKVVAVLVLTVGILAGGSGWLLQGGGGGENALAKQSGQPKDKAAHKDARPDPDVNERIRQQDDKKARVLQIKELSSELIEVEAALTELEAATHAIKYYEANVKIEEETRSSNSAIVGAKASLARAIAEKASKEWMVVRLAKKAEEKAESTLKLNETELKRLQRLFLEKAASQIDLDRVKDEVEINRAQIARARSILDAGAGAKTIADRQPVQPLLKDDDISRGLRIKELSSELIEAETALSELKAVTEGIKYYEANLKIEEQAKTSSSAILAAKTILHKAMAEKASKQWNAIRTAKKAQEKAEATLNFNEEQLKRLQQLFLRKDATQKDLDHAKTELELTRAQLARATSILDAFSGTETAADKQPGQPRPKDGIEAKISDAAVAEAEAKLERLMKLRAGGAASDAEIEGARIAVANARIAFELGTIVELSQMAVDRARQLREANVITPEELKKAVDALETAKRRQTERK
jgi:RNA polymerase sigma factor (sigma-70 family)